MATTLAQSFIDSLTTKLDKNTIEKYYLSNPTFKASVEKLNSLSDDESINEELIQTLFSLLDTFSNGSDFELLSINKCPCKKRCRCFVDGFGYEDKTHKSLNLEILRLVEVYLVKNRQDFISSDINTEEMKAYLSSCRENGFLWNYIYEQGVDESTVALLNSQLCLAKAQEIVLLNKEKEELLLLERENKCNFSVLSMLAYGVYKLYDSTHTDKLTLSKKNFFNALAWHYHLKNMQTKKEVSYKELFDISVHILKKLAMVEDTEHVGKSQTLIKTYHEIIQTLLRGQGDMEAEEIAAYPDLKYRILVTFKRPSMLNNNLATSENKIPYYSYFETPEIYKVKEKELFKTYQDLVDYNTKNLVQLILRLRCENLITFQKEVVVNEYRQVQEILDKVIPNKKKYIKVNLEKVQNPQFVKEAKNFLMIGSKIDRDNSELCKKLKKDVIFQKPTLSFAKLSKSLRDKGYYEESIQKLIDLLVSLNRHLKILMDLKTPSTMTFLIYLNEQYKDIPKYDNKFDYEDAYEKYTQVEYKDRFEGTLQQVDDFILKESNNSNIIAKEFRPEDLVDDEIFTFNKQIQYYNSLKNNINSGLKFYNDIEKSLGKT